MVSVVVCEKNLIAKDDNGFSDPYVILKVGGKQHRTKVIPRTLFPEFNESFVLFVLSLASSLSVLCCCDFCLDVCFTGKQESMNQCVWKFGTKISLNPMIMRVALH